MTDKTAERLANSGDVDQNETIEQGMQGADGNVDSNGLSSSITEHQEKLEELAENLKH